MHIMKKDSKKIKRKKIHTYGSPKIVFIVLLCVVLLVLGAMIFLTQKYRISTVIVEGNKHYSDEEIKNIVMDGKYGNNSLYLSIKYKNKSIQNIPFVETMDVAIVSADTIKITVYEKALAGYVEFLERYMYFDKDGIIVESSELKTEGIPQVTGLKFGYVVLYQRLPVDNDTIFKQILNITKLLDKYKIITDKIYFDAKYDMTLYFGDAKINIGGEDYLDEKIMWLKDILPELDGKSGTLRMENYSEDTKSITFQVD